MSMQFTATQSAGKLVHLTTCSDADGFARNTSGPNNPNGKLNLTMINGVL